MATSSTSASKNSGHGHGQDDQEAADELITSRAKKSHHAPYVSTKTPKWVSPKDKERNWDFMAGVCFVSESRIVSVSSGMVHIWEDDSVVTKRDGHHNKQDGWDGELICCAASGDGKFFASGDDDGTVVLWDSATLEVLFHVTWPRVHVFCLKFWDNNNCLVCGMEDGALHCVSLTDHQVSSIQPHEDAVASIHARGNCLVLTSSDGALSIVEKTADSSLVYRYLVRTDEAMTEPFAAVWASPSSIVVARIDYLLEVWDVDKGVVTLERLVQGDRKKGPYMLMDIAPTINTLAVALSYGEISIWSLPDLTCLNTIRPDTPCKIFCVQFSPSGYFFAIGGEEMTVKVFSAW